MSQFDFGNLSSPLPGRVLVDDNLEPWRDALHSLHKGDVRPSYAVQGLMWIDDSVNPWILKIFDGADDVVVGNIDSSSNKFLGVLHPEAITGQTDIDTGLTSTTNLLLEKSGSLYRGTIQKFVDYFNNILFGGTTVTPTGTELVALDDGTNVTAQSIADLASGGNDYCKAWVNFNGLTGAIRGSGNVSSITKSSTGTYRVNFLVDMPDTNYAVSYSANEGFTHLSALAENISYARVISREYTGVVQDYANQYVAIFR